MAPKWCRQTSADIFRRPKLFRINKSFGLVVLLTRPGALRGEICLRNVKSPVAEDERSMGVEAESAEVLSDLRRMAVGPPGAQRWNAPQLLRRVSAPRSHGNLASSAATACAVVVSENSNGPRAQ
jgi:hypothetical protein